MDQAQTAELWRQLEHAKDLQARLEALEDLGTYLSPRDEDSRARLLRLQTITVGTFSRALGRAALRLRRRRFTDEAISSAPTLKEYGRSAGAEVAKEALRNPEAATRRDFIEKAAREEAFETAPVLANQLRREQDPDTLVALARAVGLLGSEHHVLALKIAARHGEARVRRAAVEGLANLDGRERIQLLLERLGDSDRSVKAAATQAVAEIPVRKLLPLLERLPAGSVPGIQRGVLQLLEPCLEDRRVRAWVSRQLRDPDPLVSSEALLILARAGDVRAEERLDELRHNTDPRVQRVVEMARAVMPTR